MRHLRSIVLVCTALAAGCTDFAHPSELDHPQIIGLRAEPPVLAPGERSRLELLVAGPQGPVPARATWRVAGAGRIELDEDATYVVAEGPDGVTVEVSAEVDGRTLAALKWIGVGSEPGANPVMTELRIGERAVADGDRVSVAAGAAVPLSFDTAPAIDEDALVSWYSTAGDIDRYRLAAPELIANAEPGSGWLIVVYRDGRGGMCWRVVAIDVN